MLRKTGADGQKSFPIWCHICQHKHPDPKVQPNKRLKLVLGSSTLAHLWKTKGFQDPPFHIDFDCIIGKFFKVSYRQSFELLS